MKPQFAPRKARALAPLLVATALVSTPLFAQETAPQSAPAQPVVVTPPNSATVPIPPVVRTVPDGSQTAAPTADEPAAAKPQPRAATAKRTATRSTRSVTRAQTTTATRSAPVTPAPAPVAAPVPQAAVPAPQPAPPPADTSSVAPPAAIPADAPAAPTVDGTSTQSSTTASAVPLWAWVAGGIALLAIILGAALAMRGRRREYEYEEPAYVDEPYVEPEPAPLAATPAIEPVSVARSEPRKEPEYLRRAAPGVEAAVMEPVVAAPDAVEMSTPHADEVAELTAGTAPVAERPWLEFAMRPVRAGTNVDEALVEIELTVGNAGSAPARDVRISTFLLSSDPDGSEMERLLVNPPADATTDPVTIKPGEGKRIDATLALLKSEMGENPPDTIRPIIVADARYTLEDGSVGRTSASFVVGVTPEEGGPGLDPLELNRASMHENVGAELRGQPQHA
jgi:hypothetical protein